MQPHKIYSKQMSNNYFKFKKFTIEQDGCAMKVGTDGCLLGAWFCCEGCHRILDIGAGTGLISIMAAQRCNAEIVGVEIDCTAAEKAAENVKNSPWSDRIKIINTDLQKYHPTLPFDCIVSNPPYFTNSLKCDNEQRTLARHNDSLTPKLFFSKAKELLLPNGCISLVLPTDTMSEWLEEALFKGFTPHRTTYIKTTPKKAPKRVLIELRQASCGTPATEHLMLEERPGIYSKEACDLLRDFYLKIE